MATVRVEIDTFSNDGRKISTDANATKFVPNERKKTEQIRATCGPHVGRRVRLKLAFEERENDEGEERRAVVRASSVLRFIVANGVQIESEIKPKLPDAFDGGESFSRQFGTLKQHGVALQVRFKPLDISMRTTTTMLTRRERQRSSKNLRLVKRTLCMKFATEQSR